MAEGRFFTLLSRWDLNIEICDNHIENLFTFCGIPRYIGSDEQKLPDCVAEAYSRFKTIRDRGDASEFTPDSFAFVVCLSGFVPPQKKEQVSFKGVKYGETVLVKWRKKEVEALFVGLTGDKDEIIVQIPGDTEERRVKVEAVSIPQKA